MTVISDNKVLQALEDAIEPIGLRDLASHLGLPPADQPDLKSHLRKMAESGQIFIDDKRRIRLAGHMPEVCMAEVTSYDDDGYGQIEILSQDIDKALIDRSEIILVPERRRGRIPQIGARILARMTRVGPDQYEARILRILPQKKDKFFGRIVKFRNGLGIESAEKGARRIIECITDKTAPPQIDDLIEAEMIESRGRISKSASVIRNFGNADTASAFVNLAIAEFDIPHHFSDEIMDFTANPKVPELGTRLDYTDIPLLTIDGADAKDFDDAVYAEPLSDGWRVIIAIADVAAYVPENSALDEEAAKRGNSVYLPGSVVPMLPETLSNGVCSLVPHEDRASLAVEIKLDHKGEKQSHKFVRILMRSHARLTYDSVQSVYDGHADERDIGAPDGCLHHLFGIWHILDEARKLIPFL